MCRFSIQETIYQGLVTLSIGLKDSNALGMKETYAMLLHDHRSFKTEMDVRPDDIPASDPELKKVRNW